MPEYDDSIEFKELLHSYEKSRQQGQPSYFDADDFVDIAEYYMRNERLQEALTAAEDGLNLHQGDDDLRSIKANVLISLQRFDEAQEIVDTIQPEDDPDVYYFRGQLACAFGKSFDERNDWFRKWIDEERAECDEMEYAEDSRQRLREAYMHILLSIVDLSFEDDIYDLMMPWVDEYQQQCSPLEADDIDLDIARACHDAGLIDKEIELYIAFLDVKPYLPQGWTYLASLQSSVDDYEESVNSAEFALAIDASDTQAQLVRALGYYQMGNYDEASTGFKRFIDQTGDGVYYAMLGSSLMRSKRKEEALHYLDLAQDYVSHEVKSKEIKAGTRSYLAEIYLSGGYYDEALKMINLALRSNSKSPEFLMIKGTILLEQHKTALAIKSYLTAINAAERKFPVLTIAGGELMSHGRNEVAMIFLNMALRYDDDPDYEKIYIYLAQGYHLLHMPKQFSKYLKLACEHTPDLVRTCWPDDLIGVDEADYYDVLMKLMANRVGQSSGNEADPYDIEAHLPELPFGNISDNMPDDDVMPF